MAHELMHHLDFTFADKRLSSTPQWSAAQDADGTMFDVNEAEEFVQVFSHYLYDRYPPVGSTAQRCPGMDAVFEAHLGNRFRFIDENVDLAGRLCPLVPGDCQSAELRR